MLNAQFVNTWVLLRELPELINGAKGEGAGRVAEKLQAHYTDSVDILALTPEAEVLMHQPEMALIGRNKAPAYLTLLRRSVKAFGGEPLQRPISLGKKLEVSGTFRSPGSGYQDYTAVEINATPFENGGLLHVAVQVGDGEAEGTCALFDADTELPTKGTPDSALDSCWAMPPGEKGHIFHRFRQGQCFQLGVTGSWKNEKGSTNTFRARVSIVPNPVD